MASVGDDSDQPYDRALPFSELNRVIDVVMAESLRVVNLDEESPDRSPPNLPREKWRPTIITAFSGNHFPVGSLLLRSLAKAGKEAADAGMFNISVVVYSMEEFNSTLRGIFDCVVREMNEVYHIPTEARVFNFSAVPEWMRLDPLPTSNSTGEYAWKVLIIHQNCDASSVGITLEKYEKVMRPWYECSNTRQCIAPGGSSRANHRQDQSALTIISA
ncbi:hypothetical protein R1flu_023748 [Riccia fluitans]|uniref:Uncharacterized protein n=1 Tax=Riccia fluitans TaxID=41844 RepID=A0ABD1XVW6_9MARC